MPLEHTHVKPVWSGLWIAPMRNVSHQDPRTRDVAVQNRMRRTHRPMPVQVVQIANSDRGITPVVPVRLHANQHVVVSRHRFPYLSPESLPDAIQ